MAFQLIQYIDKYQITVEHNVDLTTDCIRGSSTFKARFVERMVQQVVHNKQMELQQEAIKVEATKNEDNNDAQMSG